MRDSLCRTIVAVAVVSGVGCLTPTRSVAGPLDPTKFTSLGTLTLTAGYYSISGTTLVVGNTVYQGVVSNGITVFDFSSINIAAGANLGAIPNSNNGQSNPIALLSQSTAVINGFVGVSASAFQAGIGASNQGNGVSGALVSATPPVTGPGGVYYTGGGGGGFGGAGGQGGSATFANATPISGGAGGTGYANLATLLQGGSAGGVGGMGPANPSLAGAGGGAIEIGAVQSLTIGGEVDAVGGLGSAIGAGGGSGGGIFLHANTVSLTGILNVSGGNGGASNPVGAIAAGGGGGGGGGEILVESLAGGYSSGGAQINLLGGTGAVGSGLNGSNGVFQTALLPSVVPEPSSIVMVSMAVVAGMGYRWSRRRRPSRS